MPPGVDGLLFRDCASKVREIPASLSFANVPSFEEMLKRSTRLQDRLQLINSLLAHAPENEKDAVQVWCEVQSTQALGSYDSALVEDIPMILTVAKAGGLSCVSDVYVSFR